MLSEVALRSIVARASTIFERADGRFASGDRERASVDRHLARLRQRVAAGDPVRFERYLRWHGWTQVDIERSVSAVVAEEHALPEWAVLLGHVGSTPAAAVRRMMPGDEPFAEAFAPFVQIARTRLKTSASLAETDCALSALERALVRQLAHIAARTLFAEFGAFRLAAAIATPRERVAEGVDATSAGGRRPYYDAFIAHLHRDGLERLLSEYPVLARLLATRVLGWVDGVSEFLERFTADARCIQDTFAPGRRLGPIVDLATDLSDPHSGGRTVSRLTFASGVQVIYKPRSLAMEAGFSSLLRWLNDGRVEIDLKAPVVLERGTHGWMEYGAQAGCADPAAVERYYRRAGMLLCLSYVLGGSDLHQGNVIASGEHPLLIDLEAFMGVPARQEGAPPNEPFADAGEVWDSTLRTGLLPVTRRGLRGAYYRNGGLVDVDPAFGRGRPRWRHVNTDWMTLDLGTATSRSFNRPHLLGIPVPAGAYVEAVTSGFAEMSRVLQRHRADLLGPHGPLEVFRGARARIVIRDTAVYATLLEQALHPRRLRDGATWSIEFELLKASATTQDPRPRTWNVWLAEQRAIARLDVPLFTTTVDRTGIDADGGELADDYRSQPGFGGAVARVNALDAEQTRVQLQCIRVALRTTARRAPDVMHDVSPGGDEQALTVAEAVAIAETLRVTADESDARRVRWIGIRGLHGSSQRGLEGLGWDLYAGRCGIALFFAALGSRGLGASAEAFANRILAPLVDDLAGDTLRAPPECVSTLGAVGAGGLVYGLVTSARLLKSQALLDVATRAAAAITSDAISSDERLDVIFGASGAALGLLALFDVCPHAWVLERAVLCGRHLVRRSSTDGVRRDRLAWRTDGRYVGGGFAHGSAGIAYTLARLYDRTGYAAFRDAAVDATGNDTDSARPHFTGASALADDLSHSWCQGTAGIALSRLEVSRLTRCPELSGGLRQTLDHAASLDGGLARLDHACCGNTGPIELLARGAVALDTPTWLAGARSAATQMVRRAKQRGTYAVSGVDDVFSPGFYHGLSGIGYGLLRLHFRDLPSVMLWE